MSPPAARERRWLLPAILAALIGLRWALTPASEPYFANDETRHVMTGVFLRDLLHALPLTHARAWAENYYAHFPALGLLIWPPLFHFVEGLLMCVFGTGIEVGRILVLGFLGLAAGSLFVLVRRTHGEGFAAYSTLLFGLLATVFQLSGYVMLEVPALALGLAGTVWAGRFLEDGRTRDAWAAAAFAAAAGLTRYDALVVPLFWVVWAVAAGRGRRLLQPAPWLAALAAALVLAPVYFLAWREIGWLHAATVARSNLADAGAFAGLWYYLSHAPQQLGWFVLGPGAAGLLAAVAGGRRGRALPYLALAAVTGLVFACIGEREMRHGIYWTPAVAVFAAEGLALLGPRLRRLLGAVVLLGAGAAVIVAPRPHVLGYAAAARAVFADSSGGTTCLFDGALDGDFIYQVRRAHAGRDVTVLRGDRLLYSTVELPELEDREIARSDSAVVALLSRNRVGWIVVEDQRRRNVTPGSDRLRRVLEQRAACFTRVRTIEVDSDHPDFVGLHLWVYRNRCVDAGTGPVPGRVWVPQLRRDVEGGVP